MSANRIEASSYLSAMMLRDGSFSRSAILAGRMLVSRRSDRSFGMVSRPGRDSAFERHLRNADGSALDHHGPSVTPPRPPTWAFAIPSPTRPVLLLLTY